jgi:hypothetical protein
MNSPKLIETTFRNYLESSSHEFKASIHQYTLNVLGTVVLLISGVAVLLKRKPQGGQG